VIRRSSMRVMVVDLTTFFALRPSLRRFVHDSRCTNEVQPSRVTHRSSEADRRSSQVNLEAVGKVQTQLDRAGEDNLVRFVVSVFDKAQLNALT